MKIARYVVINTDGGYGEYYTYPEIARAFGVSTSVARSAVLGGDNILTQQGVKCYRYEDYHKIKPVREHKIFKGRMLQHHPLKVHMLDRYTNEILKTFDSVAEACEYAGVTQHAIRSSARGQVKRGRGYKWEFEVATINELDVTHKPKGEIKYVLTRGDDIVYFSTQKEIADMFGVHESLVGATIQGGQTVLTRSGVLIYTLAEYEELAPIREHQIIPLPPKKSRKRAVRMIDRYTHEILDEFESVKEACEDLGVSYTSGYTSIYRSCNGKIPTAYGYKWEYVA